MPPFKQPSSLQDLCIAWVSQLIENACVEIRKSLAFSQSERYREVATLQRRVLSLIGSRLDDVCEYTFARGQRSALNVGGQMLLAMFTHAEMKTLHFASDIRKSGASLLFDVDVWETHLSKVENLTEVDLSGIRFNVDGILGILAKKCSKLEVICILGNYVTTKGLSGLGKIESLRVIKDLHQDSMHEAYKDVACTMSLLNSLPRLEYVQCCCMGEVIADLRRAKSLTLQHCWERRPSIVHIRAIEKLCPSLQSLELGETSIYEVKCPLDISCLEQSLVQPVYLKLRHLSFNSTFAEFLKRSGKVIKSLELYQLDDINVDDVQLMGKYCPNLNILRISLETRDGRYCEEGINYHYLFDEPYFKELHEFELKGSGERGDGSLLLCLSYARDIRSIEIWLENRDLLWKILDNTFIYLTIYNPLVELTSLVLKGQCQISKYLIEYLFKLPKLVEMTLLMDHTAETIQCVNQLREIISRDNLDLTLQTHAFMK